MTALADPASAQLPVMPVFEARARTVGLQLGAANPTSTHGFRQVAAGGPAVNIIAYRYINDWIAGGLELGNATFGANSRGSGGSSLNFGILGRVNFMRNRSWTTYIVGGIGAHSTKIGVEEQTTGEFKGACNPVTGKCGEDQGISASGTSITAGIGIEKFLFQGLSLSFESRFREHRFNGTSIEALHLSLGIHVWLGPKKEKK